MTGRRRLLRSASDAANVAAYYLAGRPAPERSVGATGTDLFRNKASIESAGTGLAGKSTHSAS